MATTKKAGGNKPPYPKALKVKRVAVKRKGLRPLPDRKKR